MKLIKLLLIPLLVLAMAGSAFAAFISNGDIDDEDMADISDWTDGDTGTGESSQVTFDSKSCMKLDTGANVSSSARRYRDVGTFSARTVISVNVYCDAIGTAANVDGLRIFFYEGTYAVSTMLASDGLFFYNDTAGGLVEVGTDLVQQDTWQEWTFDIDWDTQTLDVYLNQILQASDVDCEYHSATASGTINFNQQSSVTTNLTSYIDWELAGSDFTAEAAPTGQVIWW